MPWAIPGLTIKLSYVIFWHSPGARPMDAPVMTPAVIATPAQDAQAAGSVRRGLAGHVVACVVGAGIDNIFRQVALIALAAAATAAYPLDHDKAQQVSAAYGSWAL